MDLLIKPKELEAIKTCKIVLKSGCGTGQSNGSLFAIKKTLSIDK